MDGSWTVKQWIYWFTVERWALVRLYRPPLAVLV